MSTNIGKRDRDAKQIISFQLPNSLLEELDQRAEEQGVTRSETIRTLIESGLEERSA